MKIKLFLIMFLSFCLRTYSQTTYVPDDNFENYLETHDQFQNIVAIGDPSSMGNGIANDNYVITARINTLSQLNLAVASITDMTGIQDFTALTTLWCESNQITSLDLSQNQNLIRVDCFDNQISNIIFGNNLNLNTIECYGNLLSSFNGAQLPNLSYLDCGNNPMTSLDLSQNSQLALLYCGSTLLTQIDLHTNTALTDFGCFSSPLLTILDLRNGNNINLTYFSAKTSPNLSCIFVDSAAYSSTNWTNIDATSSFVETQAACDAVLGVNDFQENEFVLYPNPTNSPFIVIKSPILATYKITTINGQQLLEGIIHLGENNISIASINSGVYFITVQSDTQKRIKKLIVQ